MKTVINIVLAACVIGLIYVCYGSIMGLDIRMNMIIIAALVEGVALIAIIVCLLTLFL